LPAHLRTRLKGAPSSFRATGVVILSAPHVAATALLHFRILIPSIIEIEIQDWNPVKKQNNCKVENEKVLRVFQNYQQYRKF